MSTDEKRISTPDAQPIETQPRWRRDFPVDWPQDHYVSRRDFTKFMVLTSFAFAVGQMWIVARNFLRRHRGDSQIVQIATLSQLPIGGALTFDYPAKHDSCILVRQDEQRFVAFSQKCTHLSCAVVPNLERRCFQCPCHEGFFDLVTGAPIAGPPRRPLPRVNLEINGDVIYATGVEVTTI